MIDCPTFRGRRMAAAIVSIQLDWPALRSAATFPLGHGGRANLSFAGLSTARRTDLGSSQKTFFWRLI